MTQLFNFKDVTSKGFDEGQPFSQIGVQASCEQPLFKENCLHFPYVAS